MAGKKKFGVFAGVFTPSILTILGVIMYMRMGWVVGNAGLVGTIIIVAIAHIISLSTGLSVSSIATDKKVGAGGIYYILSRSMGIPIGGAIGITLYVGTALSIALYLIGFAESFNGYFDLDTGINGLRISGSIALLGLTAIALISTSVALKTQFFILVAIIISLISIFFGSNEFAPESINMFTDSESAPMELVFAIFFPAVTGFTAGIAMSGDLKNPKKAIPIGTLASIAVGFIVYIGLTFFISYYINADVLRNDNNILMKIALFAPAVVAGIWGATLSSALGGILGGPRILQAMSSDKITPHLFGKGKGKNNEPVNALILVFIIAQMGVLIGELDVIARVVSMFYLAAYGFINLSFFLESWANPDFQPTFKVKRWIGLIGFVACFGVMFKLDMIAMFASIIIIMGIYFWLQRKRIMLDSGDVWQSVWENVVAKGLKKLETNENTSNWNPNIILFSGPPTERQYLLEFSKTVSGRTGIVTNFNLIVKDKEDIPLAKINQSIKDDILEEMGIFGRRIEVENLYNGVQNVASTFGFSGVDPNTIMMGWPKRSQDPESYAKMTENLIHLDYNLLYLDYDERYQFGNYNTIDFWWRETDNNNAELMLNIARFIIQSPKWNEAKIRVLFVNHNNVDNNIVRSKITRLTDELRINAEIVIINNGVDQIPFYEIIQRQSASTDLIVVGIPDIKIEKQAQFILNTNHLFKSIGTTLLVKASNNFNETQLDFSYKEVSNFNKIEKIQSLQTSDNAQINELVHHVDQELANSLDKLSHPALHSISSFYAQFLDEILVAFKLRIDEVGNEPDLSEINTVVKNFLDDFISKSELFKNDHLVTLNSLLNEGVNSFSNNRNELIKSTASKIKLIDQNGRKKSVKWKSMVDYFYKSDMLPHTQHCFYKIGVQYFHQLNQLSVNVSSEITRFVESLSYEQIEAQKISEFAKKISDFILETKKSLMVFEQSIIIGFREYERKMCSKLMDALESKETKSFRNGNKLNRGNIKEYQSNILSFANDWYRNQRLNHQQLESQLMICSTACSLLESNGKIINKVNHTIVFNQLEDLRLLSNESDLLINSLDKNSQLKANFELIKKLGERIGHNHVKELLLDVEEIILSLVDHSNEIIELVDSDSQNELLKTQNHEVGIVTLNLFSIEKHILHNNYLHPLQRALQSLEEIYVSNAEELYNSANLIQHVLDESIAKEKFDHYQEVISNVKSRLNQSSKALENGVALFQQEAMIYLHDVIDALSIKTIIESSDTLSRAAQKPIIGSNFQNWLVGQKNIGVEKYKSIVEFIIRRRKDINTLKFEEEHDQFLNIIERSNNFINNISLKKEVENILPYYYKKLFTGGHLSNVDLSIRIREMQKANHAVDRIKNGISGAIMILGTSQSGKTYFTELIAKSIANSKKYYIEPPIKQTFNKADIHRAFRKTFKKKGSTELILNGVENNAIFVFNDIEKWWVKSKSGSDAINYLSQLIDTYGHRFYFLINCNIHSFDIIRKTSTLEPQLLSTIIMSPVSKMDIKEIVLNRHRTAGLKLIYEDKIIEDNRNLDRLVSSLTSKANGSIGIALNNWISNIVLEDDVLVIKNNMDLLEFPNIVNPNWKLVIYHLLIHQRLTKSHIDLLFEGTQKQDVINTLNEMIKAELVISESDYAYTLNSTAQHYIGNWLKNLNIVN